jgi:hypothetical protein
VTSIREEWQKHLLRGEQARAFRDKKKELAKVGKRPGAYMGYLPTATWLRRALYNRFGWSLTSQNLNEDRQGWYSNQFWCGRAWLSHWKEKTDSQGFQLEVDWSHGRKANSLRFMFHVGGGDSGRDVTFSVAIPHLFSYFITLDNVVRSTYRGYNFNEREFGFSVYGDHVQLKWNYHDSGEWHSDKTKNKEVNPGFCVSFFWKDKVLGRANYSTVTVKEERTTIPMPEGSYPAVVKIERATWKRSRWPWARTIYRAHIEPDKPVDVPGKGENSWDLDDGAVFSLTTVASNVPEAVAAFVENVLRTRERHGGKNWIPAQK